MAAEAQIMEELKTIKQELGYIKEHMVDIDNIMTEEDYGALSDYRKEKRAGRLISHKQLKEELGV